MIKKNIKIFTNIEKKLLTAPAIRHPKMGKNKIPDNYFLQLLIHCQKQLLKRHYSLQNFHECLSYVHYDILEVTCNALS